MDRVRNCRPGGASLQAEGILADSVRVTDRTAPLTLNSLPGDQPLLVDPLNAAAFHGGVNRVVHEAARLAAAVVGATDVGVAQIVDRSLRLDMWSVRDGHMTRSGRQRVALDSENPVAIAFRTGDALDAMGLPPPPNTAWFELAVPIVSSDGPIGAIGVVAPSLEDRVMGISQLSDIALRTALAIEYAELRRKSRSTLQETVSVLAALIEGRDTYTERHCVNLAEMSLAVGIRLGLAESRLDLLTYGGLLHDIGKIAIPDSILQKPSALTTEEFEEMKTHAGIGEEILQRIQSLQHVGPLVGQHHERFDGTGYPRGLAGEAILFEARILAVVDAFDAMTTTRPYRHALSWSRAVEEISTGAGSQFDPEVADAFLRYLEGEEAQWKTASPT
jgi:putative nucleotidyltransferase with HDIG domain